MPHQLLPYFPAATFFQKFQGSGLYSGAAYVRTFPKKPRTTHCMLCRASISTWSRSAHPQYSAITVSAAVWPPLPNSPSLSLSVCVCVVSHSNGSQLHWSTWQSSTARTGRAWENSRLKSRAGHIALATKWQQWYRDQRGLMRYAGLWPKHVRQLTHFMGHSPDVLAWQTFAHAIKPACSFLDHAQTPCTQLPIWQLAV